MRPGVSPWMRKGRLSFAPRFVAERIARGWRARSGWLRARETTLASNAQKKAPAGAAPDTSADVLALTLAAVSAGVNQRFFAGEDAVFETERAVLGLMPPARPAGPAPMRTWEGQPQRAEPSLDNELEVVVSTGSTVSSAK